MGLLERIEAARKPKSRDWPVGAGAVQPFDPRYGHDDSLFVPEEYGDYVVTSNEIFSAATLRARLLSGLDLQLYRGYGPQRAEVTSGPAIELLRRVNPFWTPRRLARMDELSMCLWGETYWAIEKTAGMPSEIWWMKPSRVRPVPHATGYLKGFLYEPVYGGEPIPFKADEVVWFRYPNPLDEFSALSPVAAARLAADTASAMMKANRNLFTNGLMPGGLVVPASDKVTFSREQAQDLGDLFDRRMKGVDSAHRWMVLRFEAQLKEMGVTPRDAEFLGGLNLTLRQVGNAYGIPTPLMNDLEHATLTNVRELQGILWAHALVPDSQLKASEITEQFLTLFPSQRRAESAEYDYSKVPALQDTATETWDRERQAIDTGAMTVNEWRKSKGMPDVAWGDVWWAPVNKSAVSDADATPQGDTTPAGDTKPAPADTTQTAPGKTPTGTGKKAAVVDDNAWRQVLAAFNAQEGSA